LKHSIERHPIPPPPIHPLAAFVTLVLDNIFGMFEIVSPFFIVLTSLAVFAFGSVTTTLIQRYLAQDSWGVSLAKGLAMGIIAGVPFQVAGTALGVPLLAWAGLHEWVKLPPVKKDTDGTGADFIEGEFRKEDDSKR
jgi:hypothetical protein